MATELIRPLLFIASDRREAQPWVSYWDSSRTVDLPVHWARVGEWQGRGVIAVANGVGSARAAAAVQAARTVTDSFCGICSIGTGGALDASLAIGDVVVAASVTDGYHNWVAANPIGPVARSGLVRTSLRIAKTAEEKRNLSATGAILVEMESAAIAQCALELAVPFYCVRAVSDLVTEAFFIDFESYLMADGTFNVPRLVMHALAHPVKGFSELLRLQRRTALAAENLGQYLANCKF